MIAEKGISDRIIKIWADKLQLEVPAIDSDLFESGALDSLAFVELLVNLEQEFGIKVSMEYLELDSFRTIARMAEFIAERVAAELHTSELYPLKSRRRAY